MEGGRQKAVTGREGGVYRVAVGPQPLSKNHSQHASESLSLACHKNHLAVTASEGDVYRVVVGLAEPRSAPEPSFPGASLGGPISCVEGGSSDCQRRACIPSGCGSGGACCQAGTAGCTLGRPPGRPHTRPSAPATTRGAPRGTRRASRRWCTRGTRTPRPPAPSLLDGPGTCAAQEEPRERTLVCTWANQCIKSRYALVCIPTVLPWVCKGRRKYRPCRGGVPGAHPEESHGSSVLGHRKGLAYRLVQARVVHGAGVGPRCHDAWEPVDGGVAAQGKVQRLLCLTQGTHKTPRSAAKAHYPTHFPTALLHTFFLLRPCLGSGTGGSSRHLMGAPRAAPKLQRCPHLEL